MGYTPDRYGPAVRRGGGLPFGQFVSQWACDPRYSTNLRTLYHILITYADTGGRDTSRGKPWRPELAAQLGKSVKTLDRTLLEGQCAGLWWIERRRDPNDSSLNDANVYHLRDGEFWRGEWNDPLAPGQSAAEAADVVVAERVEAKRRAGIKPKGGRKGAAKKNEPGVASPMTPPLGEEGGVTHDARNGVTHDAGVASLMTPNVYSPDQSTHPQPASESRPSVPAGTEAREAQTPDARMDGWGRGIDRDQAGTSVAEADSAPEEDAAAKAGGLPVIGSVQAVDASPGVALLTTCAGESPAVAVALVQGHFLRDQGLTVTGLLDLGWREAMVRQVVLTPMPATVERTESAVIAGRLRKLAGMPVPPAPSGMAPAVPAVPQQALAPAYGREDVSAAKYWEEAPTPTPPSWAELQEQQDQLRRGVDRDRWCEGDDKLCPTLAVVGETMCAAHLGWPLCPGVSGPCTRRTRDGQHCPTCQEQAFHIRVAEALPVVETEDGTCPGHNRPCGGSIVIGGGGLCPRCRIAAQRDRDRLQQEWQARVAEAVAAAEAAEALEGASAPS